MARGSVYRRGKKWYIKLDIGRDPTTGARRQRGGGGKGYNSRHDAEAALAAKLHEVATGVYVQARRDTFAEYAHYWMATIAPATARRKSLTGYEQELRLHILPILGTLRMQEIRPGHIHTMDRTLEAAGLAIGYRVNIHTRVRQILRAALHERVIAWDPAEHVKPPRATRAHDGTLTVWTGAQLDAFLVAARVAADPHYHLWYTLAWTGLRLSESLGLRWADADTTRGVLHVRQQVSYTKHDGEHFSLEITPLLKTDHSYRTVDLDAETLAVLHAHRVAQLEHRVALGTRWQAHDLVFCDRDGAPMKPQKAGHLWRRQRYRAGLPPLTIHGLRHTHATLLLHAGVNPRTVADRLGHSMATLMRTYAHTLPNAQRDALAQLKLSLRLSKEQQGSES